VAARDLTSAMATAIAAGTVRPAIFMEGEFASSQFVRLWTGVGTYPWDGHDWSGGGQLLGISAIEETADNKAVGFVVTLSGMPSANISLALAAARQGKPGKLWLALFNASNVLIADPYLVRRGLFDVMVIDDDGATCTIKAQYEDRLIDLERSRDRRYTNEDQQLDYPGDLGFEFVPSLQDMQIVWGH
jgi:hypothetical protein